MIPCYVEKQGLDRNHLQSRRIGNDVIQVHRLRGIVAKSLAQRNDAAFATTRLLVQFLDLDQSSVPLELSTQQLVKKISVLVTNLDISKTRCFFSLLRQAGQASLTLCKAVLNESQRIERISCYGIGPGDGEAPTEARMLDAHERS